MSSRVGVLVGMRSEARIVISRMPPGTLVEIGGATAAGTARAIAALIEGGATHLLSFGLAGALAPALKPGDLVAPACIIDGEGRSWPVDAAWRAQLRLPDGVSDAPMLGSDSAIGSAAEKATAYAATGAVAVDMESHLLAQAAADRPLLVLRAVADPAHRTLPPAALLPLRPDGTPDLRALLTELARHPGQLGPLIRLGLDARAAHAALGRVARLVGNRLIA